MAPTLMSQYPVRDSIADVPFLSEVPAELINKKSPAWNKRRVHYSAAPDDVTRAYRAQFSWDISTSLDARAEEVTVGGVMVLIIPAILDGIPHYSRVPGGVMFDFLGLSLMDMAKEASDFLQLYFFNPKLRYKTKGLISKVEVDSFNLPLYATSAPEMTELVAKNGRFNIDNMEMTTARSIMVVFVCGNVEVVKILRMPEMSNDQFFWKQTPQMNGTISGQACTVRLKAVVAGIINKHFRVTRKPKSSQASWIPCTRNELKYALS
ncbi:putative S-adenosylmethionine-dependent methyltransferase At5g38100 [Morella rubra]|uniref:Putative S-adenosylmethionine-dependent methyltransferase At5g38100 n=1 Tax=Morella rubra TaxID=262757 RepID=A0A6A1V3R4_9ROSI|nr:putative S-adenosylmethionine-dependent methyltransferase At5g38100 [Morella rubra]